LIHVESVSYSEGMTTTAEAARLARRALDLTSQSEPFLTAHMAQELVSAVSELSRMAAELAKTAPGSSSAINAVLDRFIRDAHTVAWGPWHSPSKQSESREQALLDAMDAVETVDQDRQLLEELRRGLWVQPNQRRPDGSSVVAEINRDGEATDRKSEQRVIRALLQARHTEMRLAERAVNRLVWAAHQSGMSQRQIAQLVDESQATVHRTIKRAGVDANGLTVSPREIVDRYETGQISRVTMLALLAEYPYDLGTYPADTPDWGYLSGSWDELAQLALEGAIDDAEFEFIVQRASGATVSDPGEVTGSSATVAVA